ncbi:hypothetical protein [Actinomadura litoris]|uniref:Uncharacterized protein n=1 Tax=Actinomadura litoris TaxID=2678616 RepID=A0A7K1LB82_9ACTN|nr:hypothetical protein [Actinomadura litoris]MUN41445.1 hypothetical protein [Actinomadura litoris]
MPPTTQQPAAWPEGVIARYLTVGGATVDLMRSRAGITAVCRGCPVAHATRAFERAGSVRQDGGKRATEQAQEWAQTHAERCRAMPRPDSE